jgi:hypothetical protein
MIRSREDRLALLLVHEAAARALRASLKDEATANYRDHGSADTWRMGGGKVTTNLSKSGAAITDHDAFVAWVAERYPTEVTTRTVVIREVRNPKWLEELLAGLDPMDPEELDAGESTACVDSDGRIIPGAIWTMGGRMVSISVYPDKDITRRLDKVAGDYAAGRRQMPGLEMGEPRVIEGPAGEAGTPAEQA